MASGYWLLASGSFNRREGFAFPISCQGPIAETSKQTLETQLIIAKRRKYISKELFETTDETIMSLQKRIGSFIATIIGEK